MGSGRIAVSTRDTMLLVVDLASRRVVGRLDAGGRVDSIASDPERPIVAAGLGDGSVRIGACGDTEADRAIRHPSPVRSSRGPCENLLLTGSADGTATVRDLASGRVVPLPGGHGNIVRAVSLSADARFAVTASADGTAKVWETAGGRLVSVLTGHGDAILDAAFSGRAGRVVTGSRGQHRSRLGQWHPAGARDVAGVTAEGAES